MASSTKVPGATVYHHARHAAVSSGKRKGGGSGRRLGRSEASHGNDGRRVGSQRGVRGAKASDTEHAECGRSTAAPHTKQRSVSVRDRSARRPATCGRGNRHEKARRKRARKQRAAEHDASSFTVCAALKGRPERCGALSRGSMRIDAGRCESMRIDAGQANPSGLPGMKVAPSCGRGPTG